MTDTHTITLPDGTLLNARLEGPEDAACVLFSNSVLTDLSIWDAQVEALKGDYRVLRYDQRGHGASGVPDGPMGFSRYGADVIDLLAALGIARCTFVGLSMGVPTGLAAYQAAPEMFERFVVVDGIAKSAAGREAFWTERRETARMSGMVRIAEETAPRWMPGVEDTAPEMVRLKAMVAGTPVEGFAAATHALSNYDLSSVARTLTCPFLGITGEKDGAMPEAVRSQFEPLPDAQFTDIPGAGHLPNYQVPDAFTTALSAFLDTTSHKLSKESR